MVDYVKLKATADRLLEQDGRAIKLRGKQTTLADPAKPWEPPPDQVASQYISTVGLFTEYEITANASEIEMGDKRLLIPAISTEPDTSFDVIDGTEVWKVVSVRKIRPGGTVMYYELQVRK